MQTIAETFPSSQRTYEVELIILNLTNGSVSDNYIEFVLNSNQQEFIDCDVFVLEMKIATSDSKPVSDNYKFTVIDGLGYRIL